MEPRMGKTALHFTAENGRKLMVALLLKKVDVSPLCTLVEHSTKVLFSTAEAQMKKTPVLPLFLATTCQSKNMMGLNINTINKKG
ncbi:uncharacterized protein ACA1_278620 [Acanthamoeba castellanii str. Neff]|uniref:Ankyrin repeat-containing protein n=1 Tax=Acanthamoeba castellanii (strain ATCC 30010 / Neff) TaxID=1257118 RepID=L8H8V3_ACACF|nr:uncharacterized protein ACA1_278620 [Acanthamoeba castellanii str. Neff]ELR20901.1 hypothetical protein ACA1_278620 [Acanthamoeba castellanii str. Neff]